MSIYELMNQTFMSNQTVLYSIIIMINDLVTKTNHYRIIILYNTVWILINVSVIYQGWYWRILKSYIYISSLEPALSLKTF